MARPRLSGIGVLYLLLAATSWAGAQTPPAAPTSYSVEPLSLWLFGEPAVTGMSDRGSLIGSTSSKVGPNEFHSDAFVQFPGGPRQSLGNLPGEQTDHPTDINENNWITTVSRTTGPTSSAGRPVVWTPQDGLIPLGLLPGGTRGLPLAINNRNQVVGVGNSTAGQRGFVWEPGAGMLALVGPAGSGTTGAFDINDRGTIVGDTYIEGSQRQHATMWMADGRFVDLGELPGGTEEAGAGDVNELDHVAGYSISARGHEAMFWSPETGMIGLGILPEASGGSASDINNNDWVIGNDTNDAGLMTPFLWTQQLGQRNLNDLLAPGSQDWVLIQANTINDRGQIMGQARRGDTFYYVRLNPVPEPAGLLLPVAGAILALRRRRGAGGRQ